MFRFMNATTQLNPARLTRLFARITTPAAASRASHRVYRLAHRADLRKDLVGRRLHALSAALNEHRHVILAGFRGDAKAVSEHVANRDELAARAATRINGEQAKVELYNICRQGRAVANGWLVARYLPDGRRAQTLRRFEGDEAAARAFAAEWNSGGPFGGNHEQLYGANLWAELHRDNYWYVVDGLDGAGKVLSGPHNSAHQALRDAALMTDTSGT